MDWDLTASAASGEEHGEEVHEYAKNGKELCSVGPSILTMPTHLSTLDAEVNMRLYLVQHGQSKPKEEDPERGLTPKGIADVQRMAAFIKPMGLTVSAVRHSGKTRAVQTAEILAEAVSAGRGIIHQDGLDPLEPVQPIARVIEEMTEDLMIVGHLPFLGNLASYLIAGEDATEFVAFQQGGVVCLEKADKAGWRVRWMVTPDVLAS